MAKIKISELQETTNIEKAYVPIEQNGKNKRVDLLTAKFSHGGTLQVSSINGNTALSAGNVDAKADYVEVQYTGSSDASFDFNNKFSVSWFTDRTNKPQRMLFRNQSSSGTVTVTTSRNANFSYNFIKVTIPAGSYAEFLVYKSIVAVTANSNKYNPLKGAIIETGHEAVCLSLSLKESGTIPSSDLAKLKEDKSRIPLFYYDGNNSNLLFPATYNWNGTKLYVQLIEPQPGNFRMTSITYSSSGVWESKKNIALDFSGDGTKFLNDKGGYVEVSAGGGGEAKTVPRLYSSMIKDAPVIAVSQPPYALPDLSYGVEGYQRIGFIGNTETIDLYLFRLTAKKNKAHHVDGYLLSTTGWRHVYSIEPKEKSNPDEENRVSAIFRAGNNIFPSGESEDNRSFYALTLKEIFLHSDNFKMTENITIPRTTTLEDFIIKMYIRQKITASGNILTWFAGNHARPICHTDTDRGNKDRWIRQWFGLSASPDGTDMRKFYCAIGVVGNDHAKYNVIHRSPYGSLCITFRVRG